MDQFKLNMPLLFHVIQYQIRLYNLIQYQIRQTMYKQDGSLQFDHVVCGGGLVGALWALYLKRKSDSVALFESYYDLRQELILGGRSINLVLSKKALDPLQEIGIRQQVLKNTIQIKGQMIHCSDGEVRKFCYGLDQTQTSYCIARNKLSECLLDIVQNNNIPIFFQHTLVDGDLDSNQYIFNSKGQLDKHQIKVKAKFMYGTDGAGSKIRELILNKTSKEANIQWYPADYKQLFLPTCPQTNDFQLDPNWVHLWPRGGHMMMGHANPNRSFSLTLILPSKGPNSFQEIEQQDKIEEYFSTYYPDLAEKIPSVYSQFSENPVGYLGTIRCPVWHYKDKVVVLGDAAHTITPFLWQAVNVGFDDCMYLDKVTDELGFTQQAFERYFQLQKPKADALAQITLNNFDNLATLSNEQNHLKLKKLQKQLEILCPQKFWSKYRLIFFGDKPYNEMMPLIEKYEQFLRNFKDKFGSQQNRQAFLIEQELNKLHI